MVESVSRARPRARTSPPPLPYVSQARQAKGEYDAAMKQYRPSDAYMQAIKFIARQGYECEEITALARHNTWPLSPAAIPRGGGLHTQ